MSMMTAVPTRTLPAEMSQDFRDAFRTHPAGVAIVTADPGTGPVGLTATSVSSVSADPPTIALNLSALSRSADSIRAAEHVVVHLLGREQLDLAQLFATPGADRFGDTSLWDRLPTGEPYLLNSRVWLRGKIVGSIDVNGSTLAAIELVETHVDTSVETAPLVYCSRTWHELSEMSSVNQTQ
ncbi:flavin reductase family protein [Corynebacterium sp. YIM 101645]|uniref:Flavin reductase family protein n=1 Tax=Corynebacterium lemuris TaxID=1859292 RepID=A0ABT2G1J2_9CORY|nr:flavin reductase family protein [Corynebacterium lemuris]MCS5480875.1 flavin reductase family protein [Corynebacterium lemuris]